MRWDCYCISAGVTGIDGFIGHSQLSKRWIDGLHVSVGDPSLIDELVTVLNFWRKNGLQLQLDTNGKNASILERLLQEGLGNRIFMDVKGPLLFYGKFLGDEVNQSEIRKTII